MSSLLKKIQNDVWLARLQLSSIGVANEEGNRRALRNLLFSAPDIEKYISGVVSLRQRRGDVSCRPCSWGANVAVAPLKNMPTSAARHASHDRQWRVSYSTHTWPCDGILRNI